MTEQRNIVVVGGGPSGLSSAHYILKHIIPSVRAKHTNVKFHVYNVSISSEFYFRNAAPRVGTSPALIPSEKVFAPISEGFKNYSPDDFTFIEAFASGLDTTARKLSYQRKGHEPEQLPYHALIIATGSKTHWPAFNMATSKEDTLSALKTMSIQAAAAKDIVIVGGGPTGIETAGELAEFRNGKPGWFTPATRNVNITLITATSRLLPVIGANVAAMAEQKLRDLGVDFMYDTRVANVTKTEAGRSRIHLANGREIEADLYIPAHGVLPNTTWLPSPLLNETNYLLTNPQTLRVDAAGPRVYAIGDVSSASRNNVLDLLDMLPVAFINLKRDLLSYDAARPSAPAPGKDRVFVPKEKLALIMPIGTAGGVGEIFGWKLPSWAAWLIKGRDYMVGSSLWPLVRGERVAKEFKWSGEEIVM